MEDFAALEPLPGGWSGETFLARAGAERSVVRIFAAPHHAPAAAEIQAALLGLVRGLVPVPGVLEARPARDGVPPMLITEYVVGARGDETLVRLGADGADGADALGRIGSQLGRIAATLAGIPRPAAGLFTNPELHVRRFTDDLADWVAAHDLGDLDLSGLTEVAHRAQALLDTVGRVSLVHGDLNPKNVLLDPAGLGVRAVVDWEYAHAGHPFTDLGNLLRFDRSPRYADGVLAGWTRVRGDDPGCEDGRALDLARAADLFALVDLAARRGAHPVADRAHKLLAAIAEQRDWHAPPPTRTPYMPAAFGSRPTR